MKLITAFALGLLLFVPVAVCGDDKKPDEKKDETSAKIVGTWEVTKATDEQLTGAMITFAKDGKLTIALGEDQKIEGTWKLEKGKLITEVGTNSDSDEIKKLTADAMELENPDKKIVVMKKKEKKDK